MSATIIGEAFVDIIFPWTDLRLGETYFRHIDMRIGGNAFIAIQVARMREKVKFLGSLGEDPFGRYIRNAFEKSNVVDLTFTNNHFRTGLCISLTDESGERILIADRGSNDRVYTRDLMRFFDQIVDSKILYFSGYSLLDELSRENILNVIRKVREKNKECEILFNLGAPNIITPIFLEVIKKYVDITILNLYEAQSITGKKMFENVAKKLNQTAKIAVITKGESGCTIVNGREIIELTTKKIKVKDTTGAGDAFSAGFITGKLRNKSLIECAEIGNRTALSFLRKKR